MDVPPRSTPPAPLLLAAGLVAFVLAGLSIADMFVPRPYDGLVLEEHPDSGLSVVEVAPDSDAARGGLRPGDRVLGIGHDSVRDVEDAREALNKLHLGQRVPYLVSLRAGGLRDVEIKLDRRQIGDGTYLYTSILGFSFFFVGLFVLVRQPNLHASQLFFVLCLLFLVFLVCRMRPPLYSVVDPLILTIGSGAFLFLPAAFLHFYLSFPRPALLEALVRRARLDPALLRLRFAWVGLYLVPPVVLASSFAVAGLLDREVRLVHGAPLTHWWLLAACMALGLVALSANGRRLEDPRERRGAALVLSGSLFGLLPFMVASLAFEASLHSRAFFFGGIMPLVLVPITFTYAVVRFQLLDIRVILRRSPIYTVTTALLTGLYAGAIATFNAFFSGSPLAESRYFPIVLALAIVLLFEPLRRRIQELVDRYFFAERSHLQRAMVELGEAMAGEIDLKAVVQELVERLPKILGLRFAALYLLRHDRLHREAGPAGLPEQLPDLPEVRRQLRRRSGFARLDQLATLTWTSAAAAEFVLELGRAGVEAVGDLASPRRPIGLVLLSDKEGQIPLESEDLELLRGLLRQVSLALETSLLLEERTQQAELERELEIAAAIQAQLLPESLRFAPGWQVAAVCRPARVVGGDFFAQLPGPCAEHPAVVFGDVSGKSVSGALMMMAAHEALHALALTQPGPAELFTLANRRVYGLGRRSFVALGYFCAMDTQRLSYLVAGQPPPLLKRADASVIELALPDHRIPVGALADSEYRALETEVAPGELVLGYSDGVTDARSPTGETFGCTRLVEVLERSPNDPEAAVHEVLAAVEAFTGDGLQYDDLTLVAVGRGATKP